MPRRPSCLSLPQTPTSEATAYRSTNPSTLSHDLSPASPRTPLTPPARLHLRTLIPSPPFSPPALTSAPSHPYPWIWRCHLCHSVYKLGVTRRCLEDGHLFCSLPTPPSSPDSASSSDSDDGPRAETETEPDALEERVKRRERKQRAKVNKERRRRKKRQVWGCRAEFDYTGWSAYNTWRREVSLFRAERNEFSPSHTSDTEEEEEEGSSSIGVFSRRDFERSEDCWKECNFPSECHNFRLERLRAQRRAAARLGRRRLQMVLTRSWGAVNGAIDVRKEIGLMQEPVGASEMLDSSSSASGLPEDVIVERERRGQEGEADLEVEMIDVPSSPVDGNLMGEFVIDELVDDAAEVEFVEKKRRKSIAKIHQLTGLMLGNDIDPAGGESPSSPLKRSFGVGEIGVEGSGFRDGGSRDNEMLGIEMEVEKWMSSDGRDLQMEELLKGRSDFVRTLTGEAEFGDEIP